MKSNLITRNGHDLLAAELKRLWHDERPEITKKVNWAASLGDRSENADYQYNKQILRKIDRRVRYLGKRLEELKIVDYVSKGAIVVPTGIIQEDGTGSNYVYVVEGSNGKTGTAKKVIVTVGKSSDNVTEILSGLNAEDIIVTEGVNSISNGMKLNF